MSSVINNTVDRRVLYRVRDLNRWIWNADRDIQLTVLCGEGQMTRETMEMRARWMAERDDLVWFEYHTGNICY